MRMGSDHSDERRSTGKKGASRMTHNAKTGSDNRLRVQFTWLNNDTDAACAVIGVGTRKQIIRHALGVDLRATWREARVSLRRLAADPVRAGAALAWAEVAGRNAVRMEIAHGERFVAWWAKAL